MSTLTQLQQYNLEEKPDLKSVLTDLFKENTGRHMLDSGSAYGRNWENNKEIDDLEEQKTKMSVDVRQVTDYDSGEPTGEIEIIPSVSMFHVLLERAEYDKDAHMLNKVFKEFVDLGDSSTSWLSEMTQFVEQHDIQDQDADAVNTYQHEFNHGDQIIQFIPFSIHCVDDDQPEITQLEYNLYGDYVILQVHGGADVRGGYTAPVVLKVRDAAMLTRIGSCCRLYDSEGMRLDMVEHEMGIDDIDEMDFLEWDEDRKAVIDERTDEPCELVCEGFETSLER